MTAPARLARIITLTSDFGLHDPYVGIMKSRIVQRAPQVAVIDLTHEITPFRPEEAGYWLHCCHTQFPAGTVHVAVVDPGVGSARALVVLEAHGQLFIAPDNGLLGLIAQSDVAVAAQAPRAYRIESPALSALGLALDSATFHGRDVMAPLAAELCSARVRASDLGPPTRIASGALQRAVLHSDGRMLGAVAIIDRYGNVLTTLEAAALARFNRPRLELDGRALRLVRTYAEARPGECVALVNSFSMLELAISCGSAARELNAEVGQLVYLVES